MTITLDEIEEVLPGATRMQRGYLLGYCPWHEDNKRSLLVFEDGWVCMGECQTNGKLYHLYDELTAPGTTKVHVEKAGKPPTIPVIGMDDWVKTAFLSMPDERNWSWKQRGIEKMVLDAKLGYWDGWLSIPIYDDFGFLKGVVARSTPHAQERTGLRFTQPTGQKPMLYVPDWNLQKSNPLFVTFGVVDAISVAELGFGACTPSSGMSSLDIEWLDWPNYIIFVPDIGEEAVAQDYAGKLGWKGKVLYLDYKDNEKDPNDMLVNRKEALKCQLKKATAT